MSGRVLTGTYYYGVDRGIGEGDNIWGHPEYKLNSLWATVVFIYGVVLSSNMASGGQIHCDPFQGRILGFGSFHAIIVGQSGGT